ncbi:hypothetical protein [Archangium violaceum]|uniref:hypothetical protein n=1 Tax=Archangium violaceum TaxID=83451 RepID=UPI0036DE7012
MRKTGMKLALLGGFAGAALLAGCGSNPYDYGRVWSLKAQDDYASEQAQGTGGAGAVDQGGEQGQENLWLKQDMRVPYPPPRLDAQVAMELGTGKPLQAVRGVWVQGTQSVELGSGRAMSVSSPGSAPSIPK